MSALQFTIPPELNGITVKTFLRRRCGMSARMLSRLKQTENGMTVRGETIKSIDKLSSGDILVLNFPEDKPYIEPVDLDVKVAYEDDNAVVYIKPPHMPVHPVGEHQSNTLANAAAFISMQRGENILFRPVNRLDKDTSGLVLAAKNAFAADHLSSHCQKTYIALCEGKLTGSGTIDAPLRVKPGHSIQREIGEGGARAVTHYAVLENYGEQYSLLELHLETGRTHQIRAHMSGIGHPLAGDDMYGGSREVFPRQCLHCRKMVFLCPVTHREIEVISDIDFFDEREGGQ